jgi:hypothetical protein
MRCMVIAVAVAGATRALAAGAAPSALVLGGDALPADHARPLAEAVARRAPVLELASPAPPPAPAPELVLGPARTLYAQMAFDRATQELAQGQAKLIEGRLPSPALSRAIADVEMWLGACALLGGDAHAAEDHFVLARRLAPAARPERIFPPEVERAFAQSRPGPAVTVTMQLAPPDARLWVDGRPQPQPVTLAPGLHYVVLERADKRPVARMLRVPRAAPQISLTLEEPAAPGDALAALAERARRGSATAEEGLAVSALVGHPLWIASLRASHLVADRFAAADPAHAHAHVEATVDDGPGALADAMCAIEGRCPEVGGGAVAPGAVVATHPRDRRPVTRRPWFWGVMGASLIVVLGVVIGASVAATSPRDYVARVH